MLNILLNNCVKSHYISYTNIFGISPKVVIAGSKAIPFQLSGDVWQREQGGVL